MLIYVDDKPAAFDPFARVLRPGGRLSLFEPVNREMRRLNDGVLFGYDTRAVAELADKVREVYDQQTPAHAAMVDLDGGDLAQLAAVGFEAVTASVAITLESGSWLGAPRWSGCGRCHPTPTRPRSVTPSTERSTTPNAGNSRRTCAPRSKREPADPSTSAATSPDGSRTDRRSSYVDEGVASRLAFQ